MHVLPNGHPMKVWLQKSRNDNLMSLPNPNRRRILERLSLGDGYEANPDGTSAIRDFLTGALLSAGGYVGYDSENITQEDIFLFECLREATNTELTTASSTITNNNDSRIALRTAFQAKMDAKRAAFNSARTINS